MAGESVGPMNRSQPNSSPDPFSWKEKGCVCRLPLSCQERGPGGEFGARTRQFVACSLSAIAFIALACASLAYGADIPEPAAEAGTTRKEILDALHDVQRKYGSDAVLIQGHLLGQAVRSGSVLEAEISVAGVEERDGKRFLAFTLVTGIIYNDREVAPRERMQRAWSDIVEATLRKFPKMSVPADGIAVRVSYTHKPYADVADLRAHLGDAHGAPEAVAFYLLVADIMELNAQRITAQQLVDRSTVLVNGAPAHIVLPALQPANN